MAQHSTHRPTRGRLACLLLVLLLLCAAAAGAQGANAVSVSVDPQDSVEAYIFINNCAVTVEPTDERMVICKYDAGALRFQQEIQRGTHILTIESISGTYEGYEPSATIYIPRDFYHHLYVDCTNGYALVMQGIQCGHTVHGIGGQVDIQYTEGPDIWYEIGLLDRSQCTLVIREEATDYALHVELFDQSQLSVPVGGMPDFTPSGGDMDVYDYQAGDGSRRISAIAREHSSLRVGFSRGN